MSTQELAKQAEAVASRADGEIDRLVATGRTADAKKAITDAQRELRDIKREATAEEQAIRADFAEAKLKTSKSGQMVGMFVSAKSRGMMARTRAMEKRRLAQNQQNTLEPCRQLKVAIDRAVAQLASTKAELARTSGGESIVDAHESEVEETSTSTAAAPGRPPPMVAAPPPAPPQWAPDPFGRHQHRYWDGQKWTEHAAKRRHDVAGPAGIGG